MVAALLLQTETILPRPLGELRAMIAILTRYGGLPLRLDVCGIGV